MFYKFLVLAVATVSSCYAASAGPSSKYRYPCRLGDLGCIGDNLAANSKCNRNVQGAIPSLYTLRNFRFETPFFNATYLENFTNIRNHNQCRVSQFFFNTEADTAVLSIDCPNLDIEANRTLVQHRSLQEDTEFNYNIRGIYPLVRLTTNIRGANAIDLCSTFTFADVTQLPNFVVNPNNKPTANYLSRDLTVLNIYERETFLYRAAPLFRYFVNSYICDFGCNF